MKLYNQGSNTVLFVLHAVHWLVWLLFKVIKTCQIIHWCPDLLKEFSTNTLLYLSMLKTWDINMVLELFDHMGDNRDNFKLSFKDFTRNLVVLFLILATRRMQPIVAIQATNCVLIEDNKMCIFPNCPIEAYKARKRL